MVWFGSRLVLPFCDWLGVDADGVPRGSVSVSVFTSDSAHAFFFVLLSVSFLA
jgi:hypothetical protein